MKKETNNLQKVLEYVTYMMVGSYFKKCKCFSSWLESSMLIEYKETKLNTQFMIEEICNDTKHIAYYSQAEKLIKAPIALITAVSSVMMPRIANEFSRNNMDKIKGYLSLTLRGLMIMAWPVAFGMAGVAHTMIPWFLGEDYMPAATAMVVLAPIIISIAASSLSANQYLLATNQTRQMTISYSASAVANLVVNAMIIPKYGFIGAAIGTIVAEYMVFVMQYYVMNKQVSIMKSFIKCLKYAVYSLIMFIVISILGNQMAPTVITTMIQVIVGVIIYIIFLLITKDKFFFVAFKKVLNRR